MPGFGPEVAHEVYRVVPAVEPDHNPVSWLGTELSDGSLDPEDDSHTEPGGRLVMPVAAFPIRLRGRRPVGLQG